MPLNDFIGIFNTTANNEFNITINKKSAINPRQNPSRSFLLRDIWIEILAEIIINIQNLISLKLSATNIEKIVSFPNDSKDKTYSKLKLNVVLN
jgi:hypothetical protein